MTTPGTHVDTLRPGDGPSVAHAGVLGEIRADRPCTECGFTLFGQPITREPHYGLLIARCPECGTVASLQEYPLASRWVGRLVALGAAAWVLMMLGLFTLGVWITGLSIGGMQTLVHASIQARVIEASGAWYTAPDGKRDEVAGFDRRSESGTNRGDALPSDSPEIRAAIDAWPAMTPALWGRLVGLTLLFTTIGVVWSVTLTHRGRGVRLLVCYAQLAIGFGISLWFFMQSATSNATNLAQYRDEVWLAAWSPAALFATLAGLIGLAGGTIWGRPLVRWLIRAALPRGLRVPFHLLWRVDNKTPA